jgi:hypothetical protein
LDEEPKALERLLALYKAHKVVELVKVSICPEDDVILEADEEGVLSCDLCGTVYEPGDCETEIAYSSQPVGVQVVGEASEVIPDRRPEPVLDRKGLLAFICDHFDDEESRTLCFILDVPYDDLPAQGRKAKARELIKHFERQDRLNELLVVLNQERPDAYTKSGLPTVT